jgi:hypothetical protein
MATGAAAAAERGELDALSWEEAPYAMTRIPPLFIESRTSYHTDWTIFSSFRVFFISFLPLNPCL